MQFPLKSAKNSEFYLLSAEGKAAGYPTNLTVGQNATVIIGVVNHEYANVTYRILVTLENETFAVINAISLSHEAKWENAYTFAVNKPGEKMKLEFLLFRSGDVEPYRRLRLWLTVHAAE